MIRPTRVGISSADLELVRAGSGFSGTLGHEFVGVVQEVNIPDGSSPAMLERRKLKGKRVVGGVNAVCSKCDMCRAGLSSHCRARTVLGVSGRDGCFADLFCLPVTNLLAVPDGLDDDRAVFAEPVAAAAHARAMFRVEGKPYISVLGDGKLGLLTVQVMARLNASVRLLGKHPEKFTLCERWGIKHRHIDQVGRLRDQDVVVDCTGSASGLALAMQLVRPRGKIVLKSLTTRGETVDLSPIVLNEIELIGSRCGPMPDAVDLLQKGHVDVLPLIGKRMKLEDGVAALEAARAKQNIKVLMDI